MRENRSQNLDANREVEGDRVRDTSCRHHPSDARAHIEEEHISAKNIIIMLIDRFIAIPPLVLFEFKSGYYMATS